MKGVQILLLMLVCIIAYLVIARLRNRTFEFLIMIVLVATAVLFICFPSLTITVANFLGVGRGTDLIFYVSTLLFWFVVLKLYVRQRNLEKIITELIRQKAIEDIKQANEQH
jgi:small membrane protein